MKKNAQTLLCLLIAQSIVPVYADVTTQKFSIGETEFVANEDSLKISGIWQSPLVVEIQPGGKFWPPINHDSEGRFFIGNKIVDTRTGKIEKIPVENDNGFLLNDSIVISPEDAKQRLQIRTGHSSCTLTLKALGFGNENKKPATDLLKDYNVVFTASDKKILGLQAHFDAEGAHVASYKLSGINPRNCEILFRTDIGNPDLLVELGWSKEGGWWMIGSIEQTLLRSRDGKHWKKLPLPKGIYSMVSGYMVSEKEIWLAGGLAPNTEEDDPMLLRSLDGGRTWRSLKQGDPMLNRVPPYWLEGISRKSATVVR
jgi:hypothetical protein